jgi:hypothetical protein
VGVLVATAVAVRVDVLGTLVLVGVLVTAGGVLVATGVLVRGV